MQNHTLSEYSYIRLQGPKLRLPGRQCDQKFSSKTNFASLTKIERQEIILSIEYSIIFIAVSLTSYKSRIMHA